MVIAKMAKLLSIPDRFCMVAEWCCRASFRLIGIDKKFGKLGYTNLPTHDWVVRGHVDIAIIIMDCSPAIMSRFV